MKITDLYWLAGIIEGEGCFSTGVPKGKRSARIRVRVSMADKDVVMRCMEITSLGHVAVRAQHGIGTKDLWGWTVTTQKDTAALMMTLYPLMGVRRQAKIRECLADWKAVNKVGRPRASK
jgi:hypothetical protein